MSTILHQGPAPAQPGTPEATALRKLGDWREKDRAHLAQKADRDAQRAEYRARQDLRGAADNLKGGRSTMTHKRAPHQGTRAHVLLAALQHGPATFYQLCERADIDIDDPREEEAVHTMLGNLVGNGVCFDGLLYRLTTARVAAPEECSSQAAGPAFRGTPHQTTVFITRRPEGGRA